jgi:hypothetical protein
MSAKDDYPDDIHARIPLLRQMWAEIDRLRAENDLALETIEALMRVIERDRPVIDAAEEVAESGLVKLLPFSFLVAVRNRRAAFDASAPDEVDEAET